MSSYFIGYSKRSRGYKFYDPKLKTIFETGTATFFEDIEFGGKNKVRDFVLEEESVTIPKPIHTVVFDKANSEPLQFKIIWSFMKNKLKILKNLCFMSQYLCRDVQEKGEVSFQTIMWYFSRNMRKIMV